MNRGSQRRQPTQLILDLVCAELIQQDEEAMNRFADRYLLGVTVQVLGATHLFTRFWQIANTAYTLNTPGFAAKVRRTSRAAPQGPHLKGRTSRAAPERSLASNKT